MKKSSWIFYCSRWEDESAVHRGYYAWIYGYSPMECCELLQNQCRPRRSVLPQSGPGVVAACSRAAIKCCHRGFERRLKSCTIGHRPWRQGSLFVLELTEIYCKSIGIIRIKENCAPLLIELSSGCRGCCCSVCAWPSFAVVGILSLDATKGWRSPVIGNTKGGGGAQANGE